VELLDLISETIVLCHITSIFTLHVYDVLYRALLEQKPDRFLLLHFDTEVEWCETVPVQVVDVSATTQHLSCHLKVIFDESMHEYGETICVFLVQVVRPLCQEVDDVVIAVLGSEHERRESFTVLGRQVVVVIAHRLQHVRVLLPNSQEDWRAVLLVVCAVTDVR